MTDEQYTTNYVERYLGFKYNFRNSSKQSNRLEFLFILYLQFNSYYPMYLKHLSFQRSNKNKESDSCCIKTRNEMFKSDNIVSASSFFPIQMKGLNVSVSFVSTRLAIILS